jgi:hypothetical protein
MSDDREARIRDRAYHIWVEHGRPEGREHDHWLEAQRTIDREQEAGYKMLKVDEKEAIGKPEHGSVVPDHRPLEEPVNKSDEPAPVHAEKEVAQSGSELTGVGETTSAAGGKGRSNAKRAGAATKAAGNKVGQAATRPGSRKSKVKSGSMESI